MKRRLLCFFFCSQLLFGACAKSQLARSQLQSAVIELNETVLFDFAKAKIRKDALPILLKVTEAVKQNKRTFLLLQGHTDRRGPSDYNELLAEKRVRAVHAFLIQHGVSYQQVTFLSYGERNPADNHFTEAAYQKNRRVEVMTQNNRKGKV